MARDAAVVYTVGLGVLGYLCWWLTRLGTTAGLVSGLTAGILVGVALVFVGRRLVSAASARREQRCDAVAELMAQLAVAYDETGAVLQGDLPGLQDRTADRGERALQEAAEVLSSWASSAGRASHLLERERRAERALASLLAVRGRMENEAGVRRVLP